MVCMYAFVCVCMCGCGREKGVSGGGQPIVFTADPTVVRPEKEKVFIYIHIYLYTYIYE